MATETTLRRCPGFAPEGIPPHDLPGNIENFNSNKGGKDGLSTRCRVCGNKYGKAWAAAKKAGTQFSVKAVPLVPGTGPVQEPSGGDPAEPSTPAEAGGHPAPAKVIVSPLRSTPVYHDELAVQAARGKAEGYTTEEIDGVIFALPVNGVVDTPEGQAALAATNEAHTAARRKRDAERKRTERAAKKQREAAQA